MMKPALSSVILHLVALGMLMFSFDLTPTLRQPIANNAEIIDAVTVDSAQVEQELNEIKALEQQRQQEREKQLADMQKQSQDAERKRQQEERRLADIKKQQQLEETRRKAEELKLVDIKNQQQQRLKEEEIKLAQAKKQQEELKKRQEEEEQQRKEEAEQKRQEELRLAEQARKKQEAERLAAEQKQRQAEQDRQDMTVSYVARIANAIEREFNTAGLTEGLSCIFEIRMIPGGEVAEVKVVKTSGNSVFDSRAEIAVKRASPLPVPDNPRIFGKMREIRLTFAPN